MNFFRLSNTMPVAQAFQKTLAREVLNSQRLRASVLMGVFGAGLLLLFLGQFVFDYVLKEAFFPGPVMPFSVVMILFQLGLHQYIAWAIRHEREVLSYVWYISAGMEITLVTLMFLIIRFNYESPTYVLSAPAILVYALFITLSTLRLDGRFAMFVGGLACVQYLAISLLIYGSVSGLRAFTPTYETLYFCVVRTGILLMCGVGAAFVARELRLRLYTMYGIMEERNRVEAANQAKSTFLANVSHEIRTPLNAILGYAQLMTSDRSLSSEQLQSIKNISTSGGHLTDLINRVLDLSKIEAGREELQVEDFDLAEMARELEAMFQLRCEQKRLDWTVEIAGDSWPVLGDVGKLRQVLVNLLGNAVKFTRAGRVTLKMTDVTDHGPQTVDQAAGSMDILFEVMDTGPGIPPEQQANIFDPFQQVNPAQQKEGTGLGLAIASGYVSMMGGQLEVVSKPDRETRFFFTLNLLRGSRDVQRIDDSIKHLAPGQTVSALVVDDVWQNRDILVQILERIGVDVQQVENGAQALEYVAEFEPDIIFMDMFMPGLSGEETMKQLRDIYGSNALKIVAVSASVLAHQRRAYLEAGFDDFLDKPIQVARVYALLHDLLQVKFVYDAASGDALAGDIDLSEAVLPADLFDGLEKAATGYNITLFNAYLDRAEALGESERLLVAPLRKLSARYDLSAALDALKEIHHG